MKFNFPVLILIGLSVACTPNRGENKNSDSTPVPVDSASEFFEKQEEVYNYSTFQGIYDHESTTKGFSAVLYVTQNGNDLLFTLSVSQSNGCKGEAEGPMFMVAHGENFYTGFFQSDSCPLEFSLQLKESKIDVKEVSLCKLREATCSFEGVYIKRKT